MSSVFDLRRKAETVRALAAHSPDRAIQWQLESLAKQFDRLAEQIARRRRAGSPPEMLSPAPASQLSA
jgi:hypothetical protein